MAGYMKITERGDVRYSIVPYTPRERPARPLFKVPPKVNPGFGSKPIPKSPRPMPHYRVPGFRVLPWLGLGLTVVDLVDNVVVTRKADPYDRVPEGFCLRAICEWEKPANWLGTVRLSTLVDGPIGCGPTATVCINGQGMANTQILADVPYGEDIVWDKARASFGLWYPYALGGGSVVRNQHWKTYRRLSASKPFIIPFEPFALAPYDMLDPNIMRDLPGSEPYPAEPPPAPLPDPAGGEWQWRSDGPPNPPPRPHTRQPPRGRNKERKARSRSAAIGIALFRALDWISEAAEVVDALYDALPKDVKARWGRDRDGRGFIDQAGQYGIDGADWKLQALYHNWHKVDVPQAIKNIVKNGVEDKVIGGISRTVPKQVINAFERQLPNGKSISPELYISRFVDWVFDEGIEL